MPRAFDTLFVNRFTQREKNRFFVMLITFCASDPGYCIPRQKLDCGADHWRSGNAIMSVTITSRNPIKYTVVEGGKDKHALNVSGLINFTYSPVEQCAV